jgi:DNA-binding response OmpR family regulator
LRDVSRELSGEKIQNTLFTGILDLADEIDNISSIRKTFDNVSRKINSFMPKEVVLVIEKDPKMRAFLSDGLALFNYSVENYDNNQDALVMIEELEMKNIPAIVVLDFTMSEPEDEDRGDTDMDFLQGINESYPHIPVIVITSIDNPRVKMKCLFIGASYFLVKPEIDTSGKDISNPDLDLFVEEISYYIWNVIKTRKLFLEREEITFAEEEIINYLLTDERFSLESEKSILDTSILVVDDEPEIRKTIKDYLADEGFTSIDTAGNGEEAIKEFEKGGHDVLIVDIVMPKKNGIEVLREVKSRSPSSQVIIVTGNADKNTAIAAVKLGAFDYIEKPFDYDLISKAVRKASEKKSLLDRVGLKGIA